MSRQGAQQLQLADGAKSIRGEQKSNRRRMRMNNVWSSLAEQPNIVLYTVSQVRWERVKIKLRFMLRYSHMQEFLRFDFPSTLV